jgi:hypothetical protein
VNWFTSVGRDAPHIAPHERPAFGQAVEFTTGDHHDQARVTFVAALVLGSAASATFAAPKALQMNPPPYSGTVTDEGQGRWTTVHTNGG